jgi:hypothetical protein
MNEPGNAQRARKLVERGRFDVEKQRQLIAELRTAGASTNAAEATLARLNATLSAFEYGLGLTTLDLTQSPPEALGRRRQKSSSSAS